MKERQAATSLHMLTCRNWKTVLYPATSGSQASDHLINRAVCELIRHKLLLSGAFLVTELSADPEREVRHAAGGGAPSECGLQRPGGSDTLWGHRRAPHCSGHAWLEPWNGLFAVIMEASWGGGGGVSVFVHPSVYFSSWFFYWVLRV